MVDVRACPLMHSRICWLSDSTGEIMRSLALFLRFFGEALWQTDGQEDEPSRAQSTRGVAGGERWDARVPCLGREQALRTDMAWCRGSVVWSVVMGTGNRRGSRDRTGAGDGGAWFETVKSDAAGGQWVRERQRPCGEVWPGINGYTASVSGPTSARMVQGQMPPAGTGSAFTAIR
jgi:hypothetical protein